MIQRLNMMLYKNDVVKLKNEDSIEDKRYLVFIKMFFFYKQNTFSVQAILFFAVWVKCQKKVLTAE